MTAVETTPRVQLHPVRTRPTNIAQQSWIMVKRNMIHTKRMPEMLSDVTVQPIMFVLLFAFVFGASIATGGDPTAPGGRHCRAPGQTRWPRAGFAAVPGPPR